jgi:hypothetical protein
VNSHELRGNEEGEESVENERMKNSDVTITLNFSLEKDRAKKVSVVKVLRPKIFFPVIHTIRDVTEFFEKALEEEESCDQERAVHG